MNKIKIVWICHFSNKKVRENLPLTKNKIINVIKSWYKDTKFKVEIEGESSEWMAQETGIRQGCPLSPYLFIIVMTVMFSEIHKELGATLIEKRVDGIAFDEILYADDTICTGTDTKTLNMFLEKQLPKAEGAWLVWNTLWYVYT